MCRKHIDTDKQRDDPCVVLFKAHESSAPFDARKSGLMARRIEAFRAQQKPNEYRGEIRLKQLLRGYTRH